MPTHELSEESDNARLLSAFLLASRLTALFPVLIGLIVFIGGWLLGSNYLKSFFPDARVMKANTALGLILAGIALLLEPPRGSPLKRRLALLCTALLVLVGGLTLVEYIGGTNLGIDELLVADPGPSAFTPPGRPAIVTSMSFFLFGAALFFRNGRRTLLLSQCLSLCVAVLNLAALIAYLLGIGNFVGIPLFTTFAAHTAASLLMLCVSLLFSIPNGGVMRVVSSDSIAGRMVRQLFPVAILVPVVLGWLRWHGELAGYYGTAFGVALLITASIAALILLIWLTGGRLDRMDRERIRALQELHETEKRFVVATAEERFRLSFEEAPVGMVLVGGDGTWLRVNRTLCEMTGYSEPELIALNHGITHVDDMPETRLLLRSILGGEISSFRQEKRYLHKNGNVVHVLLSVSALQKDETGRSRGFVAHMVDITGLKMAEKAQRESEGRFRDLLESAPDAMVIADHTGRIVLVNSQTEKLFGYPREQLLGANLETLVPHRFRVRHAGQRTDYFSAPQVRPMGELLELYGLCKDGREIPVEVSLSPLRVGNEVWVSSSIRDVTDRKRRDRERKGQAEMLSLAHDAIIVRDLDECIVFWNHGAEKMYDWSAQEAVGQNIHKMLKTVWPIPLETIDATIRRDGGWEGELRHTRRDGLEIVVESRQSLHLEDGIPTAIMEINRDITLRKRFESELEATRTQAVATARLSALGEMAAGVAHEVNNPLAIISGAASNLLRMTQRGDLSIPGLLKQIERITLTSDRIARIVKSLRHIARDDSQEDFREIPIAEIMEECLELCGEKFRVHSVRLEGPAIDRGISVRCREAQIGQVLLNLLQNAFDAVIDAHGERWVRLEAHVENGWVVLGVTDSGPGIAPEVRSRIMEPFVTTKPAGKGTGLGLSLSRSIAQAHSGTLELSEAPGHTCFLLTLPLTRESKSK